MMLGDFTYNFYEELINKVLESGYRICSYFDNESGSKCIFRHDIDFDIKKSLEMAKIENRHNISTTYFVLLKTDFYNPLSKKSLDMLKEIIKLGHSIGLHFDEKSYDENADIKQAIEEEVSLLSKALSYDVRVVSMHRPSKKTLESNYDFNGIINSYSNKYFKDYKYVSDSRRNWRENVLDIVTSKQYKNLHILTHPFWYNKKTLSLRDSLSCFVNRARVDRYLNLKDNFTNLEEILLFDEEGSK